LAEYNRFHVVKTVIIGSNCKTHVVLIAACKEERDSGYFTGDQNEARGIYQSKAYIIVLF
jgi:hypothetical protein